jgi:DNA-binding PadR family transcriptional regulator
LPIHHAVLGLLADGPSYGYELKASFEQAIGPQWGELNIGHLYQVLERLERDGYVTKRTIPQVDRPDRVVYRLTGEGKAELQRWLSEPAMRRAGYRDDFFLKLFVASRSGTEALRNVIKVQREAYLQEIASLTRLRKTRTDDPLIRLLLEAAVLHTKANLRLTDIAEETASTLAAAGKTVRSPHAGSKAATPAREAGSRGA